METLSNGAMNVKKHSSKPLMSKEEFIAYCISQDTKSIEEVVDDIYTTINNWETSPPIENGCRLSDDTIYPNGIWTYTDFAMGIEQIAFQIYYHKKCINDPSEYDIDYIEYCYHTGIIGKNEYTVQKKAFWQAYDNKHTTTPSRH